MKWPQVWPRFGQSLTHGTRGSGMIGSCRKGKEVLSCQRATGAHLRQEGFSQHVSVPTETFLSIIRIAKAGQDG